MLFPQSQVTDRYMTSFMHASSLLEIMRRVAVGLSRRRLGPLTVRGPQRHDPSTSKLALQSLPQTFQLPTVHRSCDLRSISASSCTWMTILTSHVECGQSLDQKWTVRVPQVADIERREQGKIAVSPRSESLTCLVSCHRPQLTFPHPQLIPSPH